MKIWEEALPVELQARHPKSPSPACNNTGTDVTVPQDGFKKPITDVWPDKGLFFLPQNIIPICKYLP